MSAEYEVLLTRHAEQDIDDILDYVELQDTPERADALFRRIKNLILGLEATPGRGRVVPELKRLGVLDYRELLHKPYRVLYYVSGPRVHVVAVLDGRRSLEDLLLQRLLR